MPAVAMVAVEACDLCRWSAWDERYFGLNHEGRTPLRIVRCRVCGLMTQNPRRTSSGAEAHYRAIDVHDSAHGDDALDRRRTGYELDLMRLAVMTDGRRLLDVGCAGGDFLRVARYAGWDVWGVEPSEELSELARERHNLRVRTGILDPADWEGQRFDAVTLNFVLEHVPDPLAVIAASLAMLEPEGVLYILVPNCGALEVRMRMRLDSFQGSRAADAGHAFFFTRETLSALVHAAGGTVVRARDGIGGGLVTRRVPGALRAAPRTVLASLDLMDLATGLPHLGSTLRVWARRG